jgi:hypothetical protein
VRTLLPDALDAEDLAEQERRAHSSGEEPLPCSGGVGDMELPAWLMTLVCLVVVVAMAVGKN